MRNGWSSTTPPKHGTWLNMAEIEFSVLSRCCLKQRVPHEPALRREVQASVTERNVARYHHQLALQHSGRQNDYSIGSIPYIPNMTDY